MRFFLLHNAVHIILRDSDFLTNLEDSAIRHTDNLNVVLVSLHIVQAKSAKIKEWIALVTNFRYIRVAYMTGDGHRMAILVDFHVALEFLNLFELRFRDLHPVGDIDVFRCLAGRCSTI